MKEKDFEMVESIKKLSMNKNDILVFRVDVGNLPKRLADKYMKEIFEKSKSQFPDNKVIVIPNKVDLSVITVEDEKPDKSVKIPEVDRAGV